MLSDLLYRFRALFLRKAVDAELDEELRYHLERESEKYRRMGASETEAVRRANVALGGTEQVRQQCRETRGTRLLEDMMQDLRYGVRMLRKSPGFTMVAVLTLGLGIGACTAVFSLVNAVLLRALPYKDAGRLVYLYTPNPSYFKGVPVEALAPAYADYFDVQRESHSYQAMTQFGQSSCSLASQQASERVGAARVDGDFFSVLGARPEIGRAISAAEDAPGHDSVVVISHALWQQMFAGRLDVLTKSLRLDGRSYRVIGVMPAEFGYPHDYDLVAGINSIKRTDVWVPLALSPRQKTRRDDSSGYAAARLKDGVSIQQAQTEMAAIMTRVDLLHEADARGWGAVVRPFAENAAGGVRPLMWSLLAAVALVLLIACGNAANLLLARSASRTHELGVRATLGADRWRVMRQMLTESLLLGLGGGMLGIGLAYGFVRALLRLNPGNIPRMEAVSLDGRVLCFTVIVAMLTSVLFGILPALSVSRINLVEFLKSGGNRGAVGDRSRVQSALIVAEVALVVILLAGAGLLLHSYINVQMVPTGFSASTVSMSLRLDSQYGQMTQRMEFFRKILDQTEAIPGVQAVGMISNLPLANTEDLSTFMVDGYANQEHQLVGWRSTTAQYFSAMSIPLIEGRFFREDDRAGQPLVAVVNEAFAHTYFAGRDAVGGRIRTSSTNDPWRTVVGVVANVQDASLEAAAVPEVFQPVWQADAVGGFVVIRSGLAAGDVAAAVRTILRGIDPNLALTDVRTMGELVSEASALRRFQTTLLTVFAGMALVLSLVGFYGLLAYSVKRRTAEIGLRIALGSPRARVLRMVVGQGLRLVLVGLLLGLAGALALTRVLASSLYGVRPVDPVTFVAVPALLVLVTLAASLIPGWRASSVQPVTALRYE